MYLIDSLAQHFAHKLQQTEVVLLDVRCRGGVQLLLACGLQYKCFMMIRFLMKTPFYDRSEFAFSLSNEIVTIHCYVDDITFCV